MCSFGLLLQGDGEEEKLKTTTKPEQIINRGSGTAGSCPAQPPTLSPGAGGCRVPLQARPRLETNRGASIALQRPWQAHQVPILTNMRCSPWPGHPPHAKPSAHVPQGPGLRAQLPASRPLCQAQDAFLRLEVGWVSAITSELVPPAREGRGWGGDRGAQRYPF